LPVRIIYNRLHPLTDCRCCVCPTCLFAGWFRGKV